MFVLTLALIAIAVALLFALRDDSPDVPERVEWGPEHDFGGSWLDHVPPSYRVHLNERPSDSRRPTS